LKLPKTIAKCEVFGKPNVQMILKWVATQMWEDNVNIMKAKGLVESAFETQVQMILNVKTKNVTHINPMHIHVMQ
jgi:hypothetical protein